MFYYYELVNGKETSSLSPIDKIKMAEYEVKRAEEVVKSLEDKLAAAKITLSDKIAVCNDTKKEGKKYLQEMLKEIK